MTKVERALSGNLLKHPRLVLREQTKWKWSRIGLLSIMSFIEWATCLYWQAACSTPKSQRKLGAMLGCRKMT